MVEEDKIEVYGIHICKLLEENIRKNVSELGNTLSMIVDLQRIVDVSASKISEQKK